MILASMGAMFEKSLKFSALLATILLASCGGGGGSTTSTSTITEDVITWTNGIYDSWQLTVAQLLQLQTQLKIEQALMPMVVQ